MQNSNTSGDTYKYNMKQKLENDNRGNFENLGYVTHDNAAFPILDLSGERSTTNCPDQLDPNRENNSLYKVTGMPAPVNIAWQQHMSTQI